MSPQRRSRCTVSLVFWADQRSNSRAGSAHGPSSHTQHVRFVQRAAFGALCSADDSVRGSGYLIAPGFRSDRHTRASMALPNPSRQGVAAAGDLKFAATSDVTLGPHYFNFSVYFLRCYFSFCCFCFCCFCFVFGYCFCCCC